MHKPTIRGNTITIPSDQRFLSDVDTFVENLLRAFGADESAIADIAISVSELVNNAIFHGNKAAREKEVAITCERSDSVVRIKVRDRGRGFDPHSIESPVSDENLLKEVGRGIFIVKSLMDSVTFEPSETGTTVVITKAIS